jgi:hypothetical protein
MKGKKIMKNEAEVGRAKTILQNRVKNKEADVVSLKRNAERHTSILETLATKIEAKMVDLAYDEARLNKLNAYPNKDYVGPDSPRPASDDYAPDTVCRVSLEYDYPEIHGELVIISERKSVWSHRVMATLLTVRQRVVGGHTRSFEKAHLIPLLPRES